MGRAGAQPLPQARGGQSCSLPAGFKQGALVQRGPCSGPGCSTALAPAAELGPQQSCRQVPAQGHPAGGRGGGLLHGGGCTGGAAPSCWHCRAPACPGWPSQTLPLPLMGTTGPPSWVRAAQDRLTLAQQRFPQAQGCAGQARPPHPAHRPRCPSGTHTAAGAHLQRMPEGSLLSSQAWVC